MSEEFCAGIVIGLFSGLAWGWIFSHSREIAEDESMKRHLQDLEMDIEKGKTP